MWVFPETANSSGIERVFCRQCAGHSINSIVTTFHQNRPVDIRSVIVVANSDVVDTIQLALAHVNNLMQSHNRFVCTCRATHTYIWQYLRSSISAYQFPQPTSVECFPILSLSSCKVLSLSP